MAKFSYFFECNYVYISLPFSFVTIPEKELFELQQKKCNGKFSIIIY